MSPLGYALLLMCDNNFSIDLREVMPQFPNLNKGQVKVVALFLGLRILGGS